MGIRKSKPKVPMLAQEDDVKQLKSIIDKKEKLDKKKAKEDDAKKKLEYAPGWSVIEDHVKRPITALYDVLPLAQITAYEIMNILNKTKIPDEELALWGGYGGERLFHSKTDLNHRLQTIVDYCETQSSASPGIKNKLRLVAQILTTHEAPAGVLCLLATHGGVCNVMKEVGVEAAYSLLTGTAKEYADKVSLEAHLLRHLRDLRDVIAENLYIAQGGYKNTHPLVAFRNDMSERCGLERFPDPDGGGYATPTEDTYKKFWETYSVEGIVKHTARGINQKPRKLPYDLIVEWFQKNSLLEDPYEFLGVVFDVDTGLLKDEYVRYFLQKMAILKGPAPVAPVAGDEAVADGKKAEEQKEGKVEGEKKDEEKKEGEKKDEAVEKKEEPKEAEKKEEKQEEKQEEIKVKEKGDPKDEEKNIVSLDDVVPKAEPEQPPMREQLVIEKPSIAGVADEDDKLPEAPPMQLKRHPSSDPLVPRMVRQISQDELLEREERNRPILLGKTVLEELNKLHPFLEIEQVPAGAPPNPDREVVEIPVES